MGSPAAAGAAKGILAPYPSTINELLGFDFEFQHEARLKVLASTLCRSLFFEQHIPAVEIDVSHWRPFCRKRVRLLFMMRDLAELQHDAIARGYTHDFGCDRRLLTDLATTDLRLIDSASADGGTDPGDDVTIYLIEGRGEKGYLMLSDSFHVDPKKAAWIGAVIART